MQQLHQHSQPSVKQQYLEQIIKLGSQQTVPAPGDSGRHYRNASELYRNIIAKVLNVNPQTETLQFKDWFVESKVVKENGEPMVVYHGTDWQGNVFDDTNGIWFSEKEDYAKEMAHEISEWAQRESNGDVQNGTEENGENGTRFSVNENGEPLFNVDGKYFKKWQDVIEQFKKDL